MQRDSKEEIIINKEDVEAFKQFALETLKHLQETKDPEGKFLKRLLDEVFMRAGIQMSVSDIYPHPEKVTIYYQAFDNEEDRKRESYAVRFELTYFPGKDGDEAQIWINTIFLNFAHQRRGIANGILHALCFYRDAVYQGNCTVGIFNIANPRWEEYLLSKGAVTEGDYTIITRDPTE